MPIANSNTALSSQKCIHVVKFFTVIKYELVDCGAAVTIDCVSAESMMVVTRG